MAVWSHTRRHSEAVLYHYCTRNKLGRTERKKQTWPHHSLNPWQAQHFRSKQPHISNLWQILQTDMATSQLKPWHLRYLTNKQPPHSLTWTAYTLAGAVIQKLTWPLHSLNPDRGSFWQANMATSQLSPWQVFDKQTSTSQLQPWQAFKL